VTWGDAGNSSSGADKFSGGVASISGNQKAFAERNITLLVFVARKEYPSLLYVASRDGGIYFVLGGNPY